MKFSGALSNFETNLDDTMSNPADKKYEAIYLALAAIPTGRVITYGNLARLAGMPNAARLMGRVLCQLPEGSQLPWHRVINAQGKISLPENSESYKKQKQRLEMEGVEFKNGRISLQRFGFLSQ